MLFRSGLLFQPLVTFLFGLIGVGGLWLITSEPSLTSFGGRVTLPVAGSTVMSLLGSWPSGFHSPVAGSLTTVMVCGWSLSSAAAKKLLVAFRFQLVGRVLAPVDDASLMEGISHEACSLAGAWKLGKLIALYDDNGISIDGQVAPWFADNTAERFKAYHWNVIGQIGRAHV